MKDALALEAHPGLDDGTRGALRSARAVALARHHPSPITLTLEDGDDVVSLELRYDVPSPRELSAWADPTRTTEWAAEAIALEALQVHRGLGAVRRAARGTRFDWYVGVPGTDLESATALEVGGTDAGRVEKVLAQKLAQVRKRAAGIPGIAAAVQLRTPRAMLRDA